MKMPRTAVQQTEFMRNLLAFLLVGAFISMLPVFTFKAIPLVNKDIIIYMAGQLSGMATTALGFYFVSKVGQDALDATRAENTGKMAEAVTTAIKSGGKNKGDKVGEAVDQVADAAVDKASDLKGESP